MLAGQPKRPVPSEETMTKCSTPAALLAATSATPPSPSTLRGPDGFSTCRQASGRLRTAQYTGQAAECSATRGESGALQRAAAEAATLPSVVGLVALPSACGQSRTSDSGAPMALITTRASPMEARSVSALVTSAATAVTEPAGWSANRACAFEASRAPARTL